MIKGLGRLSVAFDDLSQIGDSQRPIRDAGDVIRARARINAAQKLNRNATGQLVSDITTEVISSREAEIGVQVDAEAAKYARVHELGHPGITPKRAGALFIPLRSGVEPGQAGLKFGKDFILTQKVVIPARPYLRPAADSQRSKVVKVISESLRAEIIKAI